MRPPRGTCSLVVCDTRRAEEWRAGLTRAGFHPEVIETQGQASEHGAWAVVVPEDEAVGARAMVTAVTRGDQRLPASIPLPASARWALVLVAVLVLGVLLGFLLSRR
jgi:hypothetical protein